MSRRDEDLDPAPQGWVVIDPHSYKWADWLESEDDEPEAYDHIPTPTYTVTRTTTYTLGGIDRPKHTTIYTNRKPEEATS